MPLQSLQKPPDKPKVEPNSPPMIEQYTEERDPQTGQITRRQKTIAPKHTTEEVSEVASTALKETRQVSRITRPSVKSEQDFQTKRSIFSAFRAVRYVLVFIEILLGFRFFLKLFGADPTIGFAKFIYATSFVFVGGFNNLFGRVPEGAEHTGLIEWSTLVAAIFYSIVAWGLTKIFQSRKPVKAGEVERAVEGHHTDDHKP